MSDFMSDCALCALRPRLVCPERLASWRSCRAGRFITTTTQPARPGKPPKTPSGPMAGWASTTSEHDTRTPVWLCAGDTHTVAELVGLSDVQRAGGGSRYRVVARWLDEGIAPNGACGRGFGRRAVHGFDLTFCAPKSVSLSVLCEAMRWRIKRFLAAHTTALSEALEYLAQHVGYTRVHNPGTEDKDLVRLPGLVAIAYQRETSRAGDPHLHTHALVPNRQPRADGKLVSIDGTVLHQARPPTALCSGRVPPKTIGTRLFACPLGPDDGFWPATPNGACA